MEHKELEGDEIKEYEVAEEKEHVIEKRSKILAWLRMGIFSIFFYAFFFFAVVLLNILPTDDLYQSSINWIRDIAILPIKDIYAFIVPPDLWHNEATYITAALVLVFFSTGIFCGNEKFQNFLFEGSAIKRFFAQVLIFFGLLMGFLRLFQYLPKYFINVLTPIFVLMAGAVIWLLYQTYALYQYSRSYSSSSESFLLKHDNKFTYFIVVTATFWGLAFIGVLGYYYFIFLDIVNIIGILLQVGVNTSLWELITWILGGTMGITCLLTFIISISSKTNKRQRMYDNYSIVAANVSLWPYILLNLAIYFIFSSSTIASMSSGTGLIITYKGINLSMFIMQFLSWIELIISIVIFVLAWN